MQPEFKNKHIIVTGGANGIGRCISETFLREGSEVTVIDIDKQAGEQLQRRCEKLHFYHGDIAEKTVLERFVNSLDRPVCRVVCVFCLCSGCSIRAGTGTGRLVPECSRKRQSGVFSVSINPRNGSCTKACYQ